MTPATDAASIDAATPADRDRWADTLRVGSLLVVILGHWLMLVITPEDKISNALAIETRLQPITWLLQVMPLFFLVGGVAHAHTLARVVPGPGSYAAFVRSRCSRLMRPTLAFLVTWYAAAALVTLVGWTQLPGGRVVRDMFAMVPQLLWFVGIYLGICAFAPLMMRLHRRSGWGVVVGLVVAACLVDLARFRLPSEGIGYLNFALVWLALHQLGFLWKDGRLGRREGLALVLVGWSGMATAITWGPYPVSMVGMPGERISNMAPPTVALLAQGLGLIGLAVLLRPVMARVLARPGVWRVVVMSAPFAMTAFLWHLTALLVQIIVMRFAGIGQPEVASGMWWLTRPLYFVPLVALTAVLVALFVRFDRPARRELWRGSVVPGRVADPLAAIGVAVTFFGVLIVSMVGVDVLNAVPRPFIAWRLTPGTGLIVLLVGLGLVALSRSRSGSSRA